MSRKLVMALLTAVVAAFGLVAAAEIDVTGQGHFNPGDRQLLTSGWAIQAAAQVAANGEALSTPGFQPSGDWKPATMPATVLAALVADQVYPDPYFGMNLARIPGNLAFPLDSSTMPVASDSPFAKPWWYRTEFTLRSECAGRRVWLHFEGINFRANLFVNGRKIADAGDMAGAFRTFEFDVTDAARPGQTNALALQVFQQRPEDLGITFVDWNPPPPDRNLGIWKDVYIVSSGPVALRYPDVITDLELPALKTARLTLSAELTNATNQPVSATLKARIEDREVRQRVELAAREKKIVFFTPESFPELVISEPRVWWPAQLGPQNLYDLKMEVEAGGAVSDQKALTFGIKKVTSEMTPEGHLVFRVNGRRILIRGAGWNPDMMLRASRERYEDEVRYVRDMNLNCIRLEGKFEPEYFYDLCDRYGILVMPGWCCCDHWERWRKWEAEDYKIAEASLRDRIRELRTHASVFVWLNGSDNPPPAAVEKMYLNVLAELKWPYPAVSSATGKPAAFSGRSGVKMLGPYEYVPPIYWYEDKKLGGAHGFATEISPGPAAPPLESLRAMFSPEKLWPISDEWSFHAGRGVFASVRVFTNALNSRYGQAASVEDYAKKAQAMTYEGQRAMMEAFGRNKYVSTGVIQWMLNNGWPGLIWHLYDYYLRPGGGFFGTQRACEPLHVQYSYDDRSIVVVNSFYQAFPKMKVVAKVYNLDASEKFAKDQALDVGPDSSTRLFVIPEIPGLTKTYFLKLELFDAEGKPVSSNFYWLSTQRDTLNWLGTQWYYTPLLSSADFSDLQGLPAVELKADVAFAPAGEDVKARVTVQNPGPGVAFMVRLKITRGPGSGNDEVLPCFWEDNYFSLLPGEKRTISGTVHNRDLGRIEPGVALDGWNVKPRSVR